VKSSPIGADIRIGPQVLGPGAIKAARTQREAVHLASIFQQEIREV
jgi:hypothetical protein